MPGHWKTVSVMIACQDRQGHKRSCEFIARRREQASGRGNCCAAHPRRAYIQFKPGLITDEGEVTNASTADFLKTYMAEFHQFIVRVYTAIPRDA